MITDSAVKLSLAEAMGTKFRLDLERDNLPEREIRARLSRSRSRMSKAPVLIILCLDPSEMDSYPDLERKNAERTLAIQSAANAGLQLLLAAHAAGLGGCWLCSPMFAQEVIRRELNLPEAWEPQAMLLIGYADEHPEAKPRKPLEETVRWIHQPPK
jgi:F420 biosynthesis protein FbiB-like protein